MAISNVGVGGVGGLPASSPLLYHQSFSSSSPGQGGVAGGEGCTSISHSSFERSPAWVFWHPGARMIVSVLSITLGVVLYAEDPVGHSEERAVLGVAGPIINLFLCGFLNGDLLCLSAILTSFGAGFVLGKQMLHPFLRNHRKWAIFGYMSFAQVRELARSDNSSVHLEAHRSKGRLSLQMMVTFVALFIVSQGLPTLTTAAGLSDCRTHGARKIDDKGVTVGEGERRQGAVDADPAVEGELKATPDKKSKGQPTGGSKQIKPSTTQVVILPSPLAQLRSCSLGESRLPTTNAIYTRWMAAGTLGLDLIALLFLMETMLSDAGRDRVVVTASTTTTTSSSSTVGGGGDESNLSSNGGGGATGAMAGATTTQHPSASHNTQLPSTSTVLTIGPGAGSGTGGTGGGLHFVSSSATTKLLTRAPYFKGELEPFRSVDRMLRTYTLGLPPTTVMLSALFLLGVCMLYYVPLRWLGSCTELGRVFLASCRLLADVLLVLQDWEFPHFRQMKKVHLGPVLGERIITGKWLNFGVLACTLVLDANTVRYHLNYDPSRFGQMVKARTNLIVSRRGRHAAAYTFFEHYSFATKFLFTFPVWIGIILLVIGLKRWKIVGVPGSSRGGPHGGFRDKAPAPLTPLTMMPPESGGGPNSYYRSTSYSTGHNPIPSRGVGRGSPVEVGLEDNYFMPSHCAPSRPSPIAGVAQVSPVHHNPLVRPEAEGTLAVLPSMRGDRGRVSALNTRDRPVHSKRQELEKNAQVGLKQSSFDL